MILLRALLTKSPMTLCNLNTAPWSECRKFRMGTALSFKLSMCGPELFSSWIEKTTSNCGSSSWAGSVKFLVVIPLAALSRSLLMMASRVSAGIPTSTENIATSSGVNSVRGNVSRILFQSIAFYNREITQELNQSYISRESAWYVSSIIMYHKLRQNYLDKHEKGFGRNAVVKL